MNRFTHFLADAAPAIDPEGVCGSMVHYAFVLAFVGGAFLIFLYLWKKGKLDMDEDAKIKMMQDDKIDMPINKKSSKEKKDER